MKQPKTFLLICIALMLGYGCATQTAEPAQANSPSGTAKPGDPPSRDDIEKAMQILQKVDLVQDPLQKKTFLQEAFELAKASTNDSLVNAIIFQLSFNANITGDWAKGFEWAMLGMDRISADTKSSFYPAFSNMLAQSCEKQRDYPTALAWAQKAIQSGERNENPEYFKVNRWAARMVASKYMAILGYPLDSCLRYARESIRLGLLDSIDTNFFAYSYISMAIAFEAHQQPDSALGYFHRALAIFRETGNAFSAQETERDMARLFQHTHRPDSSQYYALKAYEAAPAVNNWDVRMDVAGILSSLYENSDKELSLAYLKVYVHLKDSLFNRDKYNAIALIQTNEQLRARDATEKERRLRSRIVTGSLLSGLFLLSLVGLMLYRNNQVRRKVNVQLAQKNEELEIEAALEKVRAESLTMQKSDQLRAVVAIMFQELEHLGFFVADGAVAVIIFRDEERIMSQWIADPDHVYAGSFDVPYTDHTMFTDLHGARKNGISNFSKLYDKAEKNNYFNYLFEHTNYRLVPEDVRAIMLGSEHYGISVVFAKNSGILIPTNSGQLVTEKQKIILTRMATVFDQAYTRFLDLQRAEGQAREAQVEAALEKVRSRTLAMHRSEELSDVASVMYQQLSHLGADLWICGFNICHPETRMVEAWISPPGGHKMAPLFMPIGLDSFTDEGFKAWQNKSGNYTDIQEGLSLKEEHEALLANPVMEIPRQYIEQHKIVPPNWVQRFAIPYSKGFLTIITRKEFNEPEILVRFAAVFDQTYTRFLDLQKAEAQAREAQIEAALERVRSRTMAMQKSEELRDVTIAMYDQLQILGIKNGICSIAIMDASTGEIEWWMEGAKDGYRFLQSYHVDNFNHKTHIEQFDHWKKGTVYAAVTVSGKDKVEYDDFYFTKSGFNLVPEETKKMLMQLETLVFSMAFMQYGAVCWAPNPIDDKDAKILQRFAKVFEQTYTRFLDLQKAEYQAREAQVEAALERVRSKTMGMQRSDELKEVVRTMYEQLRILEFQHGAAAIIVMDRETGDFDWWLNGFESGYDLPECYRVPYFDHQGHKKPLEYWKKGEKYAEIEISGKDKKTFDQYYFHATDFLKAPEHSKQLMMQQESVLFSMAFTKSGALSWSPSRISTEQAVVLQRFATVFDQTYTRFQDLQTAELQAREAMKQASLDRVRGEIASMRSQQDLDRITPLVWTELHNLGIRFSRCGIFIMDIPNQEVNIFLSSPEGKAIAAFDLDFRKINLHEVVEHWQKHAVFVTHWSQQQFAELADILVHERIISDQSHYLHTLPETGLYLHYIPFLQGMLYVAHTESLGKDELELVQSLADSFSVAYARYEDFTRMEAAKLQTETALNELKQTQAQLIQAEKMASLGELTAGIAHEIQNPLNFVNNFSDLNKELIEELQEELKKGDIREASSIAENLKDNEEKINLHGRRADGIVKSMLQHSRASSGQKEPTDINRLVDEYVRLAYHGFRAKHKDFNVTLDIQLDPEVGPVPMVAQDIGRVILNLLNNAFQAVQEKAKNEGADYQPTVSIKTLSAQSEAGIPGNKQTQSQIQTPKSKIQNQHSIAIAIEDNGPGIPDAIKEKIFQPFFTTKPTGQGTGLGLSLSYDIVKAHGGTITLQDNEGSGSIFTLVIPSNPQNIG